MMELPRNKLTRAEWTARKDLELGKITPWVDDYLHRSSRGIKHPVFDFLFTYYPYKPSLLLRWSPGHSSLLLEGQREELDWPEYLEETDSGVQMNVNLFPTRRLDSFRWIIDYLETTGQRAPVFSCFGLHEWAMVYRDGEIRHDVPLRLSREDIASVVDSHSLRCTHFDAYRFFSPQARPRNRSLLSRVETIQNDQPGCVHVAMDLYRFAHKFSPFISSKVIIDTFLLACEARTLDMRASPYDLEEFGFPAIKIEEASGREEYVKLQRELHEKAKPVRNALLGEYKELDMKLARMPMSLIKYSEKNEERPLL